MVKLLKKIRQARHSFQKFRGYEAKYFKQA